MEPLFLKPVFQERIWGGTRLKEAFDYEIPSEKTGECWAISAHSNGPSVVENGRFSGLTVSDLWEDHREIFGDVEGEQFPLLTKILDANADLSVQVHPDDMYANVYENGELGKTECWYILDCEENAQLILGHHAQTKQEFMEKVQRNEWDNLLRRIEIKKGDFFYVPSGTIHALCAGTLVLETQQSSDTTYRVYDYNRQDDKGNTRELHVEKSMDVTTVPHQDAKVECTVEQEEGFTKTMFVKSDFFTVSKLDVQKEMILEQSYPFVLCSVIEGSGKMNVGDKVYTIEKGNHFVLPSYIEECIFKGEVSLIMAHL